MVLMRKEMDWSVHRRSHSCDSLVPPVWSVEEDKDNENTAIVEAIAGSCL